MPTSKQKTAVEQLSYIRALETEFGYEIMMQFEGGGAKMKIDKADNSQTVAGKLRYFAELLERSVAERAAT